MTPAQSKGLKVGDRIIVTDTNSCLLGRELELINDDRSKSPWFRETDTGDTTPFGVWNYNWTRPRRPPAMPDAINRATGEIFDIKTADFAELEQRVMAFYGKKPKPSTKQEYRFRAQHKAAINYATVAENLTHANPIALVELRDKTNKQTTRIVVVHSSLLRKAAVANLRPPIGDDESFEVDRETHAEVFSTSDNQSFTPWMQWAKAVRQAPWPDDEGRAEYEVRVTLPELR